MKKIIFITTFFIAFIATSCHKTDTRIGNTAKVTITVINETNQPIIGATVTCGDKTATTNSIGLATIEGIAESEGKYKVQAEASNYFTGYLNVSKADDGEQIGTIKLLQKQILGTISANAATTLTGTGFKFTTTGAGFADSAGNTVSGNITVEARYINASNTDLLSETMPGGDFAATNAGTSGTLVSYGFTAFEFKNAAGDKVVPKTGAAKTAIIVSPTIAQQIAAGGAAYWVFNDQSRTWENVGAVTVVANEVYMPVSSSTFGNCDKMSGTATIKGKLICSGSPKQVKITLKSTESSSYGATYITNSNANGNFKLNVAVSQSGTVYALTAGTFDTIINVAVNTIIDIGTLDACRVGNGQFTYNGQTISGTCNSSSALTPCTGKHVGIYNSSSGSFSISNVPTASTGTFNVNAYNYGFNCNLEAIAQIGGSGGTAESTSGTITKTGAKSFTFSITMKNTSSGVTSVATGSGSYN